MRFRRRRSFRMSRRRPVARRRVRRSFRRGGGRPLRIGFRM